MRKSNRTATFIRNQNIITGNGMADMGLSLASLNSGSNGNCYYIGSSTDAVLVDAGLNAAETLRRMKHLGISTGLLRGIFISHEHTDHIRGLASLSATLDVPVYINEKTRLAIKLRLRRQQVITLRAGEPVQLGTLEVLPFSKTHDAADPVSFLIRHGQITAGVFTDIGRICAEVKRRFSECHAAILESNYDPDMLRDGPYPAVLKNRISGGSGHLSNLEALELFSNHRSPHLSLLLLGHLSAENNSPDRALELFRPNAGNVQVAVAGRYAASELHLVSNGIASANSIPSNTGRSIAKQLRLFDLETE